jgi:alpha/beta superfamily hydrolase
MEEQLYIPGNPRLFGMMYCPEKPNVKGVLIVHPFLEEKKSAQRALVETAQSLSDCGYSVLLFDMRGCGDDDLQNLNDVTLDDWIEDIQTSIDYLQMSTGVTSFSLIGLRFGAWLASCFVGHDKLDKLVLLAPVIDPISYLRKTLRNKLMKELLTGGRTTSRRADLLQSLEDGRSIDLDGHLLSGKFYHSLIRFSNGHKIEQLNNHPERVILVDITHLSKNMAKLSMIFPSLRIHHLEMEPFWLQTEHTDHDRLLQIINEIFNGHRIV